MLKIFQKKQFLKKSYSKEANLLKEFLTFSTVFVRGLLKLPSLRVRTRSKKKGPSVFFKENETFFKGILFKKSNKFFISELYNIIWFTFFTYEWYLTFLNNNRIIRKNHWKNIYFSYRDLKYRKVVFKKKVDKKKQSSKKKRKKEFNIGFYYNDTVRSFLKYVKFRG